MTQSADDNSEFKKFIKWPKCGEKKSDQFVLVAVLILSNNHKWRMKLITLSKRNFFALFGNIPET